MLNTQMFFAAIKTGNLSDVRSYIEQGSTIDIVDSDGNTPIAIAIKMGNEAIFNLLADSGAALGSPPEQNNSTNISLLNIETRKINKLIPLSFAQERLWFLEQYEQGKAAAYNMTATFILRGYLNQEALEKSLDDVLYRHEALRTTFKEINGHIQQIISLVAKFALSFHDLTKHQDQAQEIRHILSENAHNSFDLSKGPLIRGHLLKIMEKEYILSLSQHHIVSDGWSVGIFFRELSEYYKARIAGLVPKLLPLPIQYADFAVAQREWLQGDVLKQQVDYWKKRLIGYEDLNLPLDYPRPLLQTFNGSAFSFQLSQELTQSLQQLARNYQATLFTLLLTVFNILLSRYCNQNDIIVGTPIANRHYPETEGLIGFFVNTLVMRTQINPEQSFCDLLQEVTRDALEAYQHQDVPFEKIVEVLQVKRDLSRSPLFQVMLALQNATTAPDLLPCFPHLEVSLLNQPYEKSKFDLWVSFEEKQDGLEWWIEYNTDLFESATIERFAKHFEVLLKAAVNQPDKLIKQFTLLTSAEYQEIVIDWNRTEIAYPNNKAIHHLFEEQVVKTPNNIALIFDCQQLTYKELNEKANQFAALLQTRFHEKYQQPLIPDTLIILFIERSLEMVIAILGIMKAGAAYVPLDTSYPKARLQYMLEDTKAPLLVTQKILKLKLPLYSGEILYFDRHNELLQESNKNPISNIKPNNLAYVIYTSGSTGLPKGVMNEHGAIVNRILWMQDYLKLTEKDRFLQKTPYGFDVSVWEFIFPLTIGAGLVIASPEGGKDPAYLLDVIYKHNITTLHFVPSMLAAFLQAKRLKKTKKIKNIICSGEALPCNIAQLTLKHLSLHVYNLYGPTEAAIEVTAYKYILKNKRMNSVPIGKPIHNIKIYIMDAYFNPVPLGVPGELYIGGVGVARGYLDKPELTNEKFIDNPFVTIEEKLKGKNLKLYRTGDLVRWLLDGNIEFLGRLDQQVKIRGIRIELGEIETALRQHSEVNDAVVITRNNDLSDKQIVAYLTPKPYTEADHLANTLAKEHVSSWQSLYEEEYKNVVNVKDLRFNISGWNSSYTGQPIPSEEMQEWVNYTVENILSLKPECALEIGCGSGLLLSRIAPHCKKYLGLDFSQEAIQYNEILKQNHTELYNVNLLHRAADDLSGIAEDQYDLIIINSVVQYFPNAQYLKQVIENAFHVLKEGGSCFIGDIRSLSLLETFHSSVAFSQFAETMAREQIQQYISEKINQEKELLIDPDFFFGLKALLPQISNIQVKLKRGNYHNELTCFRYDIILSKNKYINYHEVAWGKLSTPFLSLEYIHEFLSKTSLPVIGFRELLNARLRKEEKFNCWLMEPNNNLSLSQFKETLKTSDDNYFDPEELYQLAEKVGFRAEINFCSNNPIKYIDVVFIKNDAFSERGSVDYGRKLVVKPLEQYTNSSSLLLNKRAEKLIPALRKMLQISLPNYMIPAIFMLIPNLPLNANGKLDRKALPIPGQAAKILGARYVAPRNILEKKLIDIWKEILKLEQVGIHDNFFYIGGHSLLVIRLVAKIKEIFGKKLTIVDCFKYPTVAEFVKCCLSQVPAAMADSILPIQTKGEKSPLFLVAAAGGAFPYLALAPYFCAQPIYGINNPRFTQPETPFLNIKEMAENYIHQIKLIQPVGPYHLGGWSFGGVVAYEMAQQLIAQGDKVNIVILIDAFYSIRNGKVQSISSQLNKYREKFREIYVNEESNVKEFLISEQLNAIKLISLYKTNSYGQKVVLIKANKNNHANNTDELRSNLKPMPKKKVRNNSNGWGAIIENLDVYLVSGTHFDLFSTQHIETTAIAIQKALQSVETPNIIAGSVSNNFAHDFEEILS